MESQNPSLDPHRLAAQTDWLRRLARQLVRDEDLAEDVVQETLLAGLVRPPVDAGSEPGLRAWLRGVAQNVVRMKRRSDGRRSARESTYATERDSLAPPSSDVVERAIQARRLMDAVLALDEPYRRAVLLAYEEQLPSRAIAERTGVSPEAARKRVSRGLAQLRDRLSAQDDSSNSNWLAGFAALPLSPKLAPTLWVGGVTMSAKALASLAVCTLLLAVGYLVATGGREEPLALDGIVAAPTEPAAPSSSSPATTSAAEVVTASQRSEATDPVAIETTALPRALRGRVLLSDDLTPVVGARLRAAGPGSRESARAPSGDSLGQTDDQGRFELLVPSHADAPGLADGLWVEHPEIFDVHVDPTQLPMNGETPLEIRTVPLGAVTVHVRDADGAPLEGIAVEYMLDPTIGSDAQLWGNRRDIQAGTSDASGDLRVTGLPVEMPLRFGLADEWRKPARLRIDFATREAEVVVTPTPWNSIRARLTWSDGAPAAGIAAIWHGTSDRSGGFGGASGTSEANGALRIADLSQGGGVLIFEGEGFHAPLPLRLEAGIEKDLGTLVLERRAVVSGHVARGAASMMPERLGVAAFRDGALVAQARIDSSQARFELQVPRGPVVLALVEGIDWDPDMPYRGSSLGELVVDAPATDIELRLTEHRAGLTGQVKGASGLVSVLVYDPEPSVDWGPPRTRDGVIDQLTLDAGGHFHCSTRAGGRARVQVVLDDDRTAYSGEVELVAGEEVDLGTLSLAPATVEARVVDANGEAQAGVTVQLASRTGSKPSTRTDESGVARFEVGAGPYAARADMGGGTSGAWQLLQVEAGATTSVTISVAGEGLFDGVVLSPEGPVPGAIIKTQRESPPTNLSWSATTGPDGRFAFQPLLPGRYRYWISGHLVGHIDLVAGEPSALTLEIDGAEHTVELRRDGAPLRFAGSLAVRSLAEPQPLWHRGERVDEGRFRVALPDGPLLFQIDLDGLGNNQLCLVPGPPRGGADYVLDLPSTGVEVRLEGLAAHRPNPAAYFVDRQGEPLLSTWGARSEVYAETLTDPNGAPGRTLRFPFLVPGTRIELRGNVEDGSRGERTVLVEATGWTLVRWP